MLLSYLLQHLRKCIHAEHAVAGARCLCQRLCEVASAAPQIHYAGFLLRSGVERIGESARVGVQGW